MKIKRTRNYIRPNNLVLIKTRIVLWNIYRKLFRILGLTHALAFASGNFS